VSPIHLVEATSDPGSTPEVLLTVGSPDPARKAALLRLLFADDEPADTEQVALTRSPPLVKRETALRGSRHDERPVPQSGPCPHVGDTKGLHLPVGLESRGEVERITVDVLEDVQSPSQKNPPSGVRDDRAVVDRAVKCHVESHSACGSGGADGTTGEPAG